jgi:hypothetical protein
MASKIKIKSGSTTIELDAAATEVFDAVVRQAAPETIRVLEQSVENLYSDAFARWPVRKTKPLTSRGRVVVMAQRLEQKGYRRDRAFAAALRMEEEGEINIPTETSSKSQNSRGKLEYGLRVSGDNIEAFVGCRAPYAWAIKVGKDTDLPFALGARVANELLWRPARAQTNDIVKTTANELENLIEKV